MMCLLPSAQRQILQALMEGWTLKSHRDIEGNKTFQLHALDGTTTAVNWRAAKRLYRRGYLQTNQKFPAATFFLTDKGRKAAKRISRDRL